MRKILNYFTPESGIVRAETTKNNSKQKDKFTVKHSKNEKTSAETKMTKTGGRNRTLWIKFWHAILAAGL